MMLPNGSDSAEDVVGPPDVQLMSREGIIFHAHKHILSSKSDFFRAMFNGNFDEQRSGVCHLRNIETECLSILIDHMYGRLAPIPGHLFLPAFQASESIGLTSLQQLCAVQIARQPLNALSHEDMIPLVLNNSTLLDRILRLDLLLTNDVALNRIYSSWRSQNKGTPVEAESRLRELARKPREVVLIYDQCFKCFLVFTGNSSYQWLGAGNETLPVTSQHIAYSKCYQQLVFATPAEIRSRKEGEAIYTAEKHDLISWPPLLRRYGESVFWTQANRKEVHCMYDGSRRIKRRVANFKSTSILVRNIATSDSSKRFDLAVIVTDRGKWKVFYNENLEVSDIFIDLQCPLPRVESLAVLNDTIYALGSQTQNFVPQHMMKYSECKWTKCESRNYKTIPKVFVPLNGRLHVICNDNSHCETYEPTIDRWFQTEFSGTMDITGFTTMLSSDL